LPAGRAAGAVRVRTFHALAASCSRGGVAVEPLVDRDELVRELWPEASPADRGRLDLAFSRLKLDLGDRRRGRDRSRAGPVARAFVAYERAVAASGAWTLTTPGAGAAPAACRRRGAGTLARSVRRVLVDEAQDLDRTQLEVALLLASPANRVFLVGDDDQTIYGWRLADVRRVLGLAGALPGLRRVDLETNYRCPRGRGPRRPPRGAQHGAVREADRGAPGAAGWLVLAPDASDEVPRIRRAMTTWPADATTRAVLARTNRELLPAVVTCLDLGLPFRAPDLPLPIEDPRIDGLLDRLDDEAAAAPRVEPRPLLRRLGRLRAEVAQETGPAGAEPPDEGPTPAALVTAMLAGGRAARGGRREPPRRRGRAARAPRSAAPRRRRADARHGARDEGPGVGPRPGARRRLPRARSIADAAEPERALEEERRLAYVAWTRARRSLTLLFDPAAPSPFLLEAFDPDELGVPVDAADAA